ncbi:MAG TPA: c-type cytochrome [Rhizomicrobium sp.]|nr:c-type cytochrome [Rhizomicrobium sp.]
MRARHQALSLAIFAALAVPGVSSASPLTDLGRDRAIESCSACHQVTKDQKSPAPVPNPDQLEMVVAPSFAAMAAAYEGKDRQLRAFIRKPQHPMKEQQFLDADLDAIVAYIHSLNGQRW